MSTLHVHNAIQNTEGICIDMSDKIEPACDWLYYSNENHSSLCGRFKLNLPQGELSFWTVIAN